MTNSSISQIVDYIRKQRAAGVPDQTIKTALQGVGWKQAEIDSAFGQLSQLDMTVQSTEGEVLGGGGKYGNTMVGSDVLSPSYLFGESWKLLQILIKRMVFINLLPFGAYLVLALIIGIGGYLGISSVIPTMKELEAYGFISLLFQRLWWILPLMALMGVIQLWSQLTLLLGVVKHDEKVSTVELYKQSLPRLLPYFGLTILSGLVIAGGFAVLVFPAIIFSLWFTVAGYVFVEENAGGLQALLKSRFYVKGKISAVFGRLFLLGVAVAVPSLLLELLISVVGGEDPETAIRLVDLGLSSLLNMAGGAFALIYTYVLFKSLKSLKATEVYKQEGKVVTLLFGGVGLVVVGIGVWVVTMFFSFLPSFWKAYDPEALLDSRNVPSLDNSQTTPGFQDELNQPVNDPFLQETL